MNHQPLSPNILKILNSISNRRAKIVIEHILEHGFITTEELKDNYGYDHPPRAARDVREAGIPLETFKVKSKEGRRSIAAYRFGDLSKIDKGRLEGRRIFPKKLKNELYEVCNGKCDICSGHFESRYLQIDHKIPYEVAGEYKEFDNSTIDYMLLCSSCNRAKSWSCEHCLNWIKEKNPVVCAKCYWGNTDSYIHIALREVRRMDIIWEENEIMVYERLKQLAQENKFPIPDFVKQIIAKHLDTNIS
jgi:hypothetical protein